VYLVHIYKSVASGAQVSGVAAQAKAPIRDNYSSKLRRSLRNMTLVVWVVVMTWNPKTVKHGQRTTLLILVVTCQ